MKRHLLMLLAVLMTAAMSLKAQVIVIDDGFENGIQDSVWTQEFVIGEHPWAVESAEDGLLWPATAWQGSKRAYLRNISGETEGYVTRLVSKVMDLRPEVIYQPELTFWYANPKWTADRDVLRVLYKTSEKGDWKQLAEYSTASASWQKVSLVLPEVSGTYQIAFEGTDNLGRGIVLDSVKLRSAPECTIPHDITINNQGAGKVTIAWNASFDANEYELIVATKEAIDPDTVANVPASALAYHGMVNGFQQNYDLTLTPGEYYYVYIRSICEGENSAWNSEDPNQGQYRFRVKATKNIPYSYGFNYPYENQTLRRDLEWTWGNDLGKWVPFINVGANEAERANYSKDATSCVVFAGDGVNVPAAKNAIPAGQYVYLATPALEDSLNANFALNQCQVRFWSTVYTFTGRNYAHSLIVGVIADPEDITTFVPMDTVSVYGTSEFVENIVDLGAYEGDAAYVAFVSAFDKQNLFFLDDITIEYKQTTQKVTRISVNPRDTYAEITWEGNAPSYKVLITNEDVDPAKASEAQIVDQATVTTNSYTCNKLEADHSWNRPYYVYVQAEGTDWSYRYPFVTIASMKEVPFSFDFEQKSGAIYTIGSNATVFYPTTMGIFSNDPEFPHLYTSNYYLGSSCLYLTKDPGNDSWITLPPVDSLQDKQLKFYLSGSSTPLQAHATVGVMTNPMDINTFIPVSDFKVASSGYTLCYANFLNYTGPNGVIAIVWSDVEGLGKNTINYIDELTLEAVAKCLPPVNMEADATSDSVVVSWDNSDATAWEFVLAKERLTENQQALTFVEIAKLAKVLKADTLTWSDPLTNPTFGYGSLNYDTPYYIYVRTMCEDEKTWWTELSFSTPCPDEFPVPFFDDFESYESVNLKVGCWTVRNQGATTYPKVTSLTVGKSTKAVDLYSTSTGSSYMALPSVKGGLDNLLLSFDVRTWGSTVSTAPKAMLIIGSMSDFDDPETFIGIDTLYLCGAANYQNIKMDLAEYTLPYDNIVFTSGLPGFASRLPSGISFTTSDVAFDNVSLKPNNCIEAWDLKSSVTSESLDVTWKGRSTNDKWLVKVQQDTTTIVNDSLIIGKSFHVEGLQPKTLYHYAIRTLCGDSLWTVDSVMTACVKLDPTKPNKENFEGYNSGTGNVPDCWTVGNGYGSGAGTSNIPYVYSSATYANSGTMTLRINESSAQNPAYAATQEIDCENMADLMVSFTMYATTSYWCVYGVMSDPTDLSTFVALDSVKGQGKVVPYSIDMSDYADQIPATAKYFGWRGRYAAADLFYLDDVSFSKVVCPLTKPSYSGLTADSVRINNGLRANNKWVLLVTTVEIPADSLAVWNLDSLMANEALADSVVVYYDTLSARTKVQLVDGLEESTDYYVATATVCDEGLSQWSTISFKTPCKPQTPEALGTIHFSTTQGYVSGTSATRYLPCWTVGNKSGNASATSSYIPYVNTTASYLFNGDSILYLYSYVPSSSTSTPYNGAYAIMPELDVDSIKDYQVNFWARTTSSTGANYDDILQVGVVTDPSDLNTFVLIDTLRLSHTAYELFTVSFENYQGDFLGNYGKYIMFLKESGSTLYGYAYIASINVEAIPTCVPVKEFTVDSIAEDAAVISFEGKSPAYRILLADKALKEEEKATYEWLLDSTVTTTDSILITDLKAATQYYVYAQAICDGGDSSAISMAYASIFTDCPVVKGYPAPYFTDFDNNAAGNGSGKRPDCWEGVQLTFDTVGTTQTYPYVYSIKASSVSEPYVLYFYSYGYWNNTSKAFTTNTKSLAVAPKVSGNLADYMVSFYAKKTSTSSSATSKYGDKLWVGYVTDASQKGMDSTFVKIAAVDVTTTTQTPYQVILSDYVTSIPEGARIALKADWSDQGFPESSTFTANTYLYAHFYVDNFKIGMPPTCFAPTLEMGNTTLTTADVTIIPAREGNDKWQLAIVPDSIYTKAGYDFEAFIDTTASAIVDADSANFTISGLTAGTQYWIYARTVCGGEDGNSAWTDFGTTTRTKFYFQDSYTFGFEKSEGYEYVYGSTSYYLHPALEAGYQGGNATTSYTTYYPYSIKNSSSAVYAYGGKPADGKYVDDETKWPNGMAGLRWESTSTIYGGYVIFPAIAEPKDRSFEFDMRNCYTAFGTMKASTPNENLVMEIGTVDKDKGFTNYEVIATVAMPKTDNTIVASAANNYLFKSFTFDVDSATMANKQIVIRQPKQDAAVYVYIDNVALGEKKGYSLVSLKKVQAQAQQATVTWDETGGPWHLYILNYNEKTKKNDTIARFENLTDVTSQLVTGLQPQTTYTALLVSAIAPKNTKFEVSSTKTFRTPCLPLEPNANGEFVWDFNDKSEWERSDVQVGNNTATDTAYYKPSCFTTGTTYTGTQSTSTVYYNWLIQRKGYSATSAPTTLGTSATSTARYEYGRGDSPALRVYTTSTYMTPYIVLPELNCSFDTMMIEFYGRCFSNYAEDYGTASSQNKINNNYLGSSYSKSIVVGTLTDPKDFSTLKVIDTVSYKQTNLTTSTLVNSDPAGLRYWEKMQLPLAAAEGKYIVLFQAGYGLFFLDDLSVKPVGDNLFAPSGAQTGKVTTTTAEFSWRVKHPTIQTVVVVLNQDGDREALRDTIPGNITTYTAEGLTPATGYQWYMYQTNGTIDTDKTPYLVFNTECLPTTPDYTTGFELEDGWKILPAQTSATYKQTQCWVYENAGSAAVGTNEYNIANSSTIGYSHDGSYALKMYAYSTTQQNYAVMPAMDITAYDTLQVNFWMRPGYHGLGTSANAGKISTQYTVGSTASTAEYYYSRDIIVGTMTDPYDVSTFVAIDTVHFNGTLAVGDVVNEANDYLFQKKKVALTGATGPYVTFMTTLYMKGETRKSTSQYMYLDDISFSAIQHCDAPEEMKATDISASKATLNWEAPEGAEKFVLQVSTDLTFSEDTAFVFNDTVLSASQVVTGLEPNTQYIWRVRTICGEDLGESEFSQNATFTSARIPFFVENFSETSLDGDWSFGTNPAALVIDSTDVEIEGSNNSTYGFKRITTNYGISGPHYTVPCYTSSSTTTTYRYYWMISPIITLNETDSVHLTMDFALTATSTSTPSANAPTEAQMADDYTFLVILSEDGGKTWKKENILGIWNNKLPAGHQLRDIPSTATNLRINLAKYAGKDIRIAFYREAITYISNNCAFHIGNIRVINYDMIEESATACQYEDVDQLGFYIDGDKAEAGEKTLKRLEKAHDMDAYEGAHDSIYVLNVEYIEVPETIYGDTICEGDTYTGHDFQAKERAGIYRKKLESAEHCDSLVTLYLYVTPRAYADDEIASICKGETFTWNEKSYNSPGVYRDTTVSAAGCDSVMTLMLSYYDDEDTIYDAVTLDVKDDLPFTYQNVEHPYIQGQAPITYATGTPMGTYKDTALVQGVNCTAVLILTVEIKDKHEGVDNIVIGEGANKVIYRDHLYIIMNDEWYTAEGKKVQDPRK